jgi:(p)ppGpp synthase/HD superfamily hydrolase
MDDSTWVRPSEERATILGCQVPGTATDGSLLALLRGADSGQGPRSGTENRPARERRVVLARTLRDLSSAAWSVAPAAQVQARVKSVESMLSKMRRKGLGAERILDFIGVRIIVPEETHCYRLVDRVHRRFAVVGSEYDDYIRNPKPNGYRSLHTTILGADGQPVEVQVRTSAMHALAERGRAAHWLYKLGQRFRTTRSLELPALALPSY